MSELIANIIDETAEQVKLFLNLDKLSSTALVDEIFEEKNLVTKLSKFMKLVMDRLQFSQDPAKYYNSVCANIMGGVRNILPNAPQTANEFAAWLPAQLEEHRHEIKRMRKKLQECQEALVSTKNSIGKYANEYSEKIKILEEKVIKLKTENKNLKERYSDREDFLKYHKSQVSIAESKQQRAEQSSFELQKNNYDLKLKIFDLQSNLENMRRENAELRKSLKSKSEQTQYDILERNELMYQMDQFSRDMRKIEKLQGLPCRCFNHGTNWKKTHKELHKLIFDLENQNEQLRQQLQQAKTDYNMIKYTGTKKHHSENKIKITPQNKENKEHTRCCSCCNCKCHYLDVNSLKRCFDNLESDVEELRKEIDGNLN